ncbi:hypothetical protein EZV62_017431 [Acer yangbiense]|uniref:RNase H type-1 domain-containing protein n=1 Tax=Acer yangbiense TaxID=1000413 RepID=A0A5C7HH69_9ROSI|nr:hypothetical protein EZV62_017431 [Acer yangbiense]
MHAFNKAMESSAVFYVPISMEFLIFETCFISESKITCKSGSCIWSECGVVDAALDKSKDIFSLGVVARDRTGKLLWAGAKCFNGFIDAETAETLAILDGVHLAISENLNPVIVESDTVNAINLCLGNSLSRCEVDNIAQVIHDFNRESTNNISLCFSPRSCNLVAHGVARWPLGSGSSIFWITSFPYWLCKLIRDDGCVNLSVV